MFKQQYSKGYSSYRTDKKVYADADADADAEAKGIRPKKNNMSPHPSVVWGWGGGIISDV